MTNTPTLTVVKDPELENPRTATISLLDVIAEPDESGARAVLETLRIGADASFVSLFTGDVAPLSYHYLERDGDWDGTYAQCLGAECPACKAGLTKTDGLLLPVMDRLDGRVKVMRITRQKGPGKLLTELGQILAMPNRDRLVVRITRDRNYVNHVAIEAEESIDPDLAQAVATFMEKVESGVIEIPSVIPFFSAEEMATHGRIAKRLSLVRRS